MRYEPYDYELKSIPTMDNEELLEYFLTRIYETEEIWGIRKGGHAWITYDRNSTDTMPFFHTKHSPKTPVLIAGLI
jgi:hypothetical protein